MDAASLDKQCENQETKQKQKQPSNEIPKENIVSNLDVEFGKENKADALDDLVKKSEDAYIDLAEKIVEITDRELNEQQGSKSKLKGDLTKFFKDFLLLQYIFIIVMLLFNGSSDIAFSLSDSVIKVYITSVFVETLGCVVFMVKYAFNSNQEVELIKILNNAITNYQKYNRFRASNDKNKDLKQNTKKDKK